MTIYRGPGGTGTASSEVDTTEYQEFLVQAQAAKVAAEAARDAALAAETNAELAETNAETAETNAETAETNANASASAAASSASAAATSASNAATSASEAAASAAVVNPANIVYNTNTYANPSWLTSLAWSKVTGTPTTIAGYDITNAYTKTEVDASLATKQAADTELTTLAGMSSNRATFLASNEGFGFRNRIINGDMRIDQRNAGASVTPASNGPAYLLDRFAYYNSQVSKLTYQQNAGGVTPPAGFSNYLGVTVASAATVGSSDVFLFYQPIEGFNVSDLAWGTANAQSITISFWVRSSLTGNFSGALQNSGNARTYAFPYSISQANTWERKAVSVNGDTAGTWLTNNGTGITINFSLGAGSSLSTAGGSWVAGNTPNVTGSVNLVATAGATFYITGVQLEAGSVASPFERRDYGRELMMCQRYWWPLRSAIGVIGTSTSIWRTNAKNPVFMRTNPTLTLSGSMIIQGGNVGGFNLTSVGTNYSTNEAVEFDGGTSTAPTTGTIAILLAQNSNYIGVSAEL